MRKLTTYKRPSVARVIELCGSVEALGRVRAKLNAARYFGHLDPSDDTVAKWERLFWQRVLTIMLTTANPCQVYNYIKLWPKPPVVESAIEAAFESRTK
jgi:hypothetical protein